MGPITQAVAVEIAERRARYHDRPDLELLEHLLVAVQRERVAAVGYDTAKLAERLARAPLVDEAREVLTRAITQIWLDETLHARYVLGVLLRQRELLVKLGARREDLEGGVGGWMTAVLQHGSWADAPGQRLTALIIEAGGKLTGKIPVEVREALVVTPLRDWCAFSADAEESAVISFGRIIELADEIGAAPERHPSCQLPAGFRQELVKMRRDERAHQQVFALIAAHLDHDDGLCEGTSLEGLRVGLGGIEGWLSEPRRDAVERQGEHPVCRGGLVVVGRGEHEDEKIATFDEALERAGFFEVVAARPGPIAIKVDLMLAYHRDDPSSTVDPVLVEHLVDVLRARGHRDISVCDAQNVYGEYYANRSIEAVARYVGLSPSPQRYRLVDLAEEQEPHAFGHAMGIYAVGRTWRDAAMRISFAKLKSHPTAIGQLTLRNVGTVVPQTGEYFFGDRLSDFSRVTAALLHELPPHFGIIDGYSFAADGLMGVLAGPAAKHPRTIVAGADVASVDYVGFWLMGERDPSRAPDVRAAMDLLGDPRPHGRVLGDLTPFADWQRAEQGLLAAPLSAFASPVYATLSQKGALFTAPLDPEAFPAIGETFALGVARRAVRALLGIG